MYFDVSNGQTMQKKRIWSESHWDKKEFFTFKPVIALKTSGLSLMVTVQVHSMYFSLFPTDSFLQLHERSQHPQRGGFLHILAKMLDQNYYFKYLEKLFLQ